jgi:predicted nucleic acid-binding protein
MNIVADSSVLIALSTLGELELLKELFGEVFIPKAVWREVVEDGMGQTGAEEVRAARKWLKVKDTKQEALKMVLNTFLDEGEAEAIALALEFDALVLLDEKDARKFAELTGINVLGTVGILILAKRQNIVKSLRKKLEELEMAGFRLSSEIHEKALESVGEL